MPSMVIRDPKGIEALSRRLLSVTMPITVNYVTGERRSSAANRLAQQWAADVSAQLGDRTPEQVRGHFKLHHGVPIRREDEGFAAVYDRVLRPLPYEAKLACMMAPIDMPVTRDMTKAELTRYLDSIQAEFTPMGVRLTDPDELKWGAKR